MCDLTLASAAHVIKSEEIYKDHNGISVIANSGRGLDGHSYEVYYPKDENDPLVPKQLMHMHFQSGAVPINGVNGITNEILLAILINRTKILDCQYPCTENKLAISHMEDALGILEQRTARRISKGIEGKMTEC
jgi:hypothetical protein